MQELQQKLEKANQKGRKIQSDSKKQIEEDAISITKEQTSPKSYSTEIERPIQPKVSTIGDQMEFDYQEEQVQAKIDSSSPVSEKQSTV